MADSGSSYDSHSNISTDNEVTLHRYVCYKCSGYEEQLREVINEHHRYKSWFGGICVLIRLYCQLYFSLEEDIVNDTY